jgi:Sigma-70 region 2.
MYQTFDLGEFVAKNHKDILRILRSKGWFDPDDAADLSQSLYLNLAQYNALERYDGGKGSFKRYIYVILDRVIGAYRKANDRQAHGADSDWADPAPAPDFSVLERIKAFQLYCRQNHVPRLEEINDQIRARASGKFLDCPGRFHFLRVRKEFLIHEQELEA